jgi:hypothetical protein
MSSCGLYGLGHFDFGHFDFGHFDLGHLALVPFGSVAGFLKMMLPNTGYKKGLLVSLKNILTKQCILK